MATTWRTWRAPQLANSDAVAEKVAADEPGVSASSLLDGLTVTVPPNTQILTIDYKAADEDAARSRADGFAHRYLDLRAERANQAVVAQARKLQDEIDSQRARLNKLAVRKTRVTAPEQRAVLQQQIDGVTAQVIQLSTTLSAVQTTDRDPGAVITPAHIVGRPPQQQRTLFTLVGLLVGCAAGVLVLVMDARRRRGSEAAASSGVQGSTQAAAEWAGRSRMHEEPSVHEEEPSPSGWTSGPRDDRPRDDRDDRDDPYPNDLVRHG